MTTHLTAKQRILLDEILSRDEDVQVIPWPKRTGVKIGLRLLTESEMRDADACARAWAADKGLDTSHRRGLDNEYSSRYASEVLFRALVSPDGAHQPVVQDVDQLSDRITRPELALLMHAYRDYAGAMFSDPDALTPEQCSAIVEELRGPFVQDRLMSFDPVTLRALLRYTVARLPASTGSESSPTP